MNRITMSVLSVMLLTQAFAQRGKDGNVMFTSSNVIVNSYTSLTLDAHQGDNVINVASTTGLGNGDLILVIQMQGALLKSLLVSGLFNKDFGEIVGYGNCGLWEFQEINSIISNNQLRLDCGLKNSYDTLGHVQIVKVPRYNQFHLVAGSTLTCPAWDGTTGGIVAVESLEYSIVNGQINVIGKGFRGGKKDNGSASIGLAVYDMASNDSAFGGEKGEGIGGYGNQIIGLGGRYGRGAVANGGGGGNSHNSAGGGGANAGSGVNPWTGIGNPDYGTGNIYSPMWALDTGIIGSSDGGGRGGYSYSHDDQDASLYAPGNLLWGGNNRENTGGYGGRPLNNGLNSERVFFGGGGGAGDGNENVSTSGGNGGGIVFIVSHAGIWGSGFIRANGLDAGVTPPPGKDGSGGGGGGGSVVLIANNSISTLDAIANGGQGGSQNIGAIEAEGPGGGGGGGYIASTGGSFNQQATGGANGTTNSLSMTEFPPNGATRGGDGLTNQNVNAYAINTTGATICPGQTATIQAALSGNYPQGTVLNWYTASSGGYPFYTGTSWTTPPLYSNTTYWVGSCPGFFRAPVTVNIFQPPAVNAGFDTSVCPGTGAQLTATGGLTYSWSPAAGLDNPAIYNPLATPTTNTTYTVTISDINGCTNTDEVVVSLHALPQIVAGATQPTICLGSFTQVYATGGVSYQWNTGQTVPAFTVSPFLSCIYDVTATDNNGCSNTASVTVTVLPLPLANAGNDTSVCFGSGVELNASGGVTYSWQPATTLSNSTIHNPIATPQTTTTYTVTVFNTYGCSLQDHIVVTVNPLPQVSAGSNQSVCLGDSTTLSATGGVSYVWSNGDNTQAVSVAPQVNTTYTVTATDILGCSNTSDVSVTVLPLPMANAGMDTNICPGGTTQLHATGGISYTWSPSGGLNQINIQNPVASPTMNITYTVVVTDSNGCVHTDNVAVGLYPEPVVYVEPDVFAGCPPLNVYFTDTASNIVSWLWNFGDPLSDTSNTSVLSNPSHVFNTPGTYSVALTLTSNHGCVKTGFFTNLITVYPKPVASFEPLPPAQSVFQPVFSFTNNSVDAVSYLWEFGDNLQTTSNLFEPTYTYDEEGNYTVTLYVLSQDGCTDTTNEEVVVKPEYTFFVPNVFTPNEDGLNDYFQGIGRNFKTYHMLIYDRWGKLIYETDEYSKPWDGRVRNSNEVCPVGVYVYVITVVDFKNRKFIYRGEVTLLSKE